MPARATREETAGAITKSLQEWRKGDTDALSRLTTAVYRELRRLAGSVMLSQSRNRTIQPTALVHELYLHLPGVQHIDFQSRAQFLNVAAMMMRNILVDHARKRHALKRGGRDTPMVLDSNIADPAFRVDVLEVHEALERFARKFPRQAKVVELRFFGGLTVAETVEVLAVTGEDSSPRTVERDWMFSKAWLHDALKSA
jgi:RNA polymerase sigma factor (TIGR02999 family)